MLKIGEFSRIAHVTVKTLRYYAREGLLTPVWTDRFSGYRYYSLDQLPLMNRILALKDLGFTIDQIRQILDESLSAAELRGMLRMKQVELKQHLLKEQQRLSRVEKRLIQIEQEGLVSSYEVVLRQVSSKAVVWAETHAASEDQVEEAREGLRELIRSWCNQNHVRICGAWFTRINNVEYSETNVDIQLGVQVEDHLLTRTKKTFGPVNIEREEEIPSAACLLGESGALPPLPELLYWIDHNGYKACGVPRVVWLGENPEIPLARQMIEVQIPVICTNNSDQKEIEMEPVNFVTLPSFKVMGMKYHGKNENMEIPAMWSKLNKRASEIPMIDRCAYGVCLMLNNTPGSEFDYIAGFKVDASSKAPEGMTVMEVPESRYAVFEHRGSLETLHQTYASICNDWFPRSGMQPVGTFDMEVYDEKFKDFAPDSVFYIYEPVK